MAHSGTERQARQEIDRLLDAARWHVCDMGQQNIHAHSGVAIREFPLPGHGFADYLLYVNGKAAGVLEAKKTGATLIGVETQSAKYTDGLPNVLPSWSRPLPFAYESTGVETRFTNGFDPQPRSRPVFAFHRPETVAEWLEEPPLDRVAEAAAEYLPQPSTFLSRMRQIPPLIEDGLWGKQGEAVKKLEESLKDNRPRALVQMATGSGKTYTAITQIYRLIKFGGAKRVQFLVDRGNLAEQTEKEFQQYRSPYNNFKFTEEYIVQRLQSNTIDTTARVCICTIQRLYSMLSNCELPEADDEASIAGLESLFKQQPPIEYNPHIPIETFDVIITDECHRCIYNLWAQLLEYGHVQAVADGVNVNYDVFRIRTAVTEQGSKIEAGFEMEKQDRENLENHRKKFDDLVARDSEANRSALMRPYCVARMTGRAKQDKVGTIHKLSLSKRESS